MLRLIETPDIIATLGGEQKIQSMGGWVCLGNEDRRFKAIVKMQRKCCDMMVSNGPRQLILPTTM